MQLGIGSHVTWLNIESRVLSVGLNDGMWLVDTLFFLIGAVGAIDCFKCVSLGGKNPACEDPFHNNFTSDLLESPCMGGRKGRNGLFPATACLKLSGIYGNCFIFNSICEIPLLFD